MSDDNLNWLNRWYLAQCNSVWEHSYGIKIDTLDNPGWSLKIKLIGTSLEGRAFEDVAYGHPSSDLEEWQHTGSWWVAHVKDGTFEAFCGPLDLSDTIGVFRRWVEQVA